jgi:hypothetical protein
VKRGRNSRDAAHACIGIKSCAPLGGAGGRCEATRPRGTRWKHGRRRILRFAGRAPGLPGVCVTTGIATPTTRHRNRQFPAAGGNRFQPGRRLRPPPIAIRSFRTKYITGPVRPLSRVATGPAAAPHTLHPQGAVAHLPHNPATRRSRSGLRAWRRLRSPASSVFVKLRSFARKRWTLKNNGLHFAKLTCKSGAWIWRSSVTPG